MTRTSNHRKIKIQFDECYKSIIFFNYDVNILSLYKLNLQASHSKSYQLTFDAKGETNNKIIFMLRIYVIQFARRY